MENKTEENSLDKVELKGIKKYLFSLKKGYLIIIILSIIFMLFGLILANFIFNDNTLIDFKYRYNDNVAINIDDIISENNINKVKSIEVSYFTGGKISTYKYVDIKNISISKNDEYYEIKVYKDSFNLQDKEGKINYNNTAAKGFLQHLAVSAFSDEITNDYNNRLTEENNGKTILGISKILDMDYITNNDLDDAGMLITIKDNTKTKYMIIFSISGFVIGLLLSLLIIYIFLDKLNYQIKRNYDNVNIYRTPFHLSFFTNSIKCFKDLKSLVLMALLLGIVMVCKFIPIPSGFGDLGLSFSYLFLSTAAMIFGPIPALLIGALSDIIGFLIKPSGVFFIGYTFQAMLACFFYALTFHKTYITFTRCLIARLLVNIICNVIIGSICNAIIMNYNYDAFYTYLITISLPKNVIYLLPQSLLLYFVLKAIAIPLSTFNMVDRDIAKNVSFF